MIDKAVNIREVAYPRAYVSMFQELRRGQRSAAADSNLLFLATASSSTPF